MKPPACPPIWLWSDLHLEFNDAHIGRAHPPLPPAGQMVVLAGDIAVGTAGVRWAIETFPDNPVAYVLGNHEAYYSDLDITIRACRDAAWRTNVRILERDEWDFAPGTRLLGATLWTDYSLWNEQDLRAVYAEAHRLADHRVIATGGRVFLPADAHRRHLETREWLEMELRRAHRDNVRAIVVTHHAPHPLCIDEAFRRARDPLSAAFASDLSDLLTGHTAPALWLSGHTHHNHVGTVGRTHLVSNQGGYAFRRGEEVGFLTEGMLVSETQTTE